MKDTLNHPKSAATRYFLGARDRARKRRVERAVSVRATEVLLYTASID